MAETTSDAHDLPLFLSSVKPPLDGDIYHIEAQEHYVRVATASEKRMLLYRFSDAIREMPSDVGMQVHRSHWVAYKAVVDVLKEGQSLKLALSDNNSIPVSRSFRTRVEEKFSAIKTKPIEA